MLNHSTYRIENRVLFKPENLYCIVKTIEPLLTLFDFRGNRVRFDSRKDIQGIRMERNLMTLFNFYHEEDVYKRKGDPTLILQPVNAGFALYKDDKLYASAKYVHELQNILYYGAAIEENPNLAGI